MKFLKNSTFLGTLAGSLLAVLSGCSSSDIPDSCSADPLSAEDSALLKVAFMESAGSLDSMDPENLPMDKLLDIIRNTHSKVEGVLKRNPQSCEAQLSFALTNELNIFNEESLAKAIKNMPLDGKPSESFKKEIAQNEKYQKIIMEKVLPTHDISTAYLHNVANNAQFKYSFLPGVSLEQPDFQTILAAFHLMRCFIVSYGSLNFDGLETIPEDFWISIDKSTDWENLNDVQRDGLNKLIKLMTAPDSKFLGVKKEYAAESRKNRASLDSMVTYLDLALTGYSTNDKYGIGLDKILMARMVIPFVKEALRGKVLDIGEIASGVVGPIAAAEVSKEAYNTLGFTKVNFAKIFDLTEGYQKYLPRFTYDEKNPLSLESYYFVDKDGKKTVSFDKIEQLEPEELSKQVYLPDPTVGGVFPDAKTPNPLVSLVAAPGFISLGVVSAFALPEMFGEASKSKAAELATIFAAYQTAQNAYVLMNGTLGAFEVVDFDLPQSDLFIYLPDEEGIMAMSLSDLGKCGAGSSWTLTPIMNEAEIDQWIVLVNNAGGDDSDCMESLIPGLSTLGNVISAKQSVLDPEEGE